jgi:8-oxo-dGTP diphosphatase
MSVPKKQRVAAYGICVRDGRVLLARWVAPDGERLWTMPGGGIDHGEDPADAVVRELEEETGYHVEVEQLLGVDSHVWLSVKASGEEFDTHGLRIIYRLRVVGGELRDEVGGSTDMARWFPFDEVAGLERLNLVDAALAMWNGSRHQ